jgi:hypothetical protein
LHTLDFYDILAYYATAQTTAVDILDVLQYSEDDGTELVQRSRRYFENWLRTTSQEMLGLLIQAITGSAGITSGMRLYVILCL